MRRLFTISIIGLIVSVFPAFVFTAIIYEILRIYLQSQGEIYVRVWHGYFEVASPILGRGLYISIWILYISGSFFFLFIGFLIIFAREWRIRKKIKRAREREFLA